MIIRDPGYFWGVSYVAVRGGRLRLKKSLHMAGRPMGCFHDFN